MIKILTVIGARPQIIKAAALSRAITNSFSDKLKEIIVHTGQHYDTNMSEVFFDELNIPRPDYNLNVGSGSHGKQTASMIEGIEEILLKEKPGCIVLYGDTNSTLAGAVAASKINIPVIHIEAGLRSFNKSMPEEVNRIMCDHVSTLLFSPTKTGYRNLIKEGFKENNQAPFSADNPKIFHCGDVMYDNSLYFSEVAEKRTNILAKNELKKNEFILATIHRNNNTDEPERINSLFSALHKIATENKVKIVLPLHPRTAKLLSKNLSSELYSNIKLNKLIQIIEPVSFLEMIALEKNALLVMTDSGGVQKEAFFFKKPCIILRSETEWVELVECGSAKIVDADEKKIIEAFNDFRNAKNLKFADLFGDGKAAEFICNEIIKL
ncbi:MAG: UDP-N-acetylglucosamine 2-epimerase (non-hydrolyzing) [Bacteroidetes bacterium]|jgi:UDP-GlcNAc3NAcA epimerase|nr:UDP-N-acetylglucosamine 2-epimerase (non-hydrolyzing) [Bacteroidota bacterium]